MTHYGGAGPSGNVEETISKLISIAVKQGKEIDALKLELAHLKHVVADIKNITHSDVELSDYLSAASRETEADEEVRLTTRGQRALENIRHRGGGSGGRSGF